MQGEIVPVAETVKDEPDAGWPSFGQLVANLSKFAFESLGNIFMSFVPFKLRHKVGVTKGFTLLKDSLIMPEDQIEPPLVQKTRTPAPLSEIRQTYTPKVGENLAEMKLYKIRSSSMKDPSLSTKHRSPRREEYAKFYGSSEVPVRSKSQKERSKHRQREKSGEVNFWTSGVEPKPAEMKAVNYDDAKFNHYNLRNKYSDSYRFD